MKTLKEIITKYMYQLTAIIVAMMLFVVLFAQMVIEQKRAYETSVQMFRLMNNRLIENEQELQEVQEGYKQTCLYNAQVIAKIIEKDPSILNNLQELRDLARLLEIDEIHIIDRTGRIFTGTHPEYYNLTFDSGEQIGFFKPMLEDKSLSLVQDITPNTAEDRLMQYSAVWSEKGEYIVQVGMEPVNVSKVTEKNEISYIFYTFRLTADAIYYDLDSKTGKIIGSTKSNIINHYIEDEGISFKKIKKDFNGFHAKIDGELYFCVFQKMEDTYLGRAMPVRVLYQRIPSTMLILSACLILMAFVLVYVVSKHINRYVVREIDDINDKLSLITDGELHETIDVRSSREFSRLSDYLNTMLNSILNNNIKLSYVLSTTNLMIGVYEYNETMRKVQYTEYVPYIFDMNLEQMEQLSFDVQSFKEFINQILNCLVDGEPNVYMVGKRYIRLEEINNQDGVFGVVLDVTEDIIKRREIETERDIDLLTGLYNRRGLELRLTQLFYSPDKLGYYAMVMMDADGLKEINDTYGHEGGDMYLKKIGELLLNAGNRDKIAARQGGDEFILFLYHYQEEEELKQVLETLAEKQNTTEEWISEGIRVPVRFSMGYFVGTGLNNYSDILKVADEKMYQDKARRKAGR